MKTKFKAKDIVVVTEHILTRIWIQKAKAVGYMFRISGADVKRLRAGEVITSKGNEYGINYEAEDLRLATDRERNAWEEGLEHIQDIEEPEYTDNYPIY